MTKPAVKLQLILCILVVLLIATGCGGKKLPALTPGDGTTSVDTMADNTATSTDPNAPFAQVKPISRLGDEQAAACIYSSIIFRKGDDFKAQTTKTLDYGEPFTFLGFTQVRKDGNGKYDTEYYQLKLSDGTEGWAWADGIILNVYPAAVGQDANVFKLNDLAEITSITLEAGDIVFVAKDFSDPAFIRIYIGTNKNNEYYLEKGKIIDNKIELAIARNLYKAASATTLAERRKILEQLLTISSYKSAYLYPVIQQRLEDVEVQISADAEVKPAEPKQTGTTPQTGDTGISVKKD